jgi:hypothetical protein
MTAPSNGIWRREGEEVLGGSAVDCPHVRVASNTLVSYRSIAKIPLRPHFLAFLVPDVQLGMDWCEGWWRKVRKSCKMASTSSRLAPDLASIEQSFGDTQRHATIMMREPIDVRDGDHHAVLARVGWA